MYDSKSRLHSSRRNGRESSDTESGGGSSGAGQGLHARRSRLAGCEPNGRFRSGTVALLMHLSSLRRSTRSIPYLSYTLHPHHSHGGATHPYQHHFTTLTLTLGSSQGHDLALAVLSVPDSLDSGRGELCIVRILDPAGSRISSSRVFMKNARKQHLVQSGQMDGPTELSLGRSIHLTNARRD